MADTVRTDSLSVTEPIPIRVGTRTAFELRAGIEELTLDERVEAINRRIARVRDRGPANLERRIVALDSSRWEIRLGETLIMIVGPNDAASAGITADSLSAVWLTGLQAVLASEERSQEIGSIAWKVTVGLLFPILLWGVFVLLGRLWHRIDQKMDAFLAQRTRGIHIRGFALIQADTVSTLLPTLVRVLKGVSYVVVIYIGIVLFFSFFPQTRPMGNRMLDAVIEPVKQIGYGMLDFMPLIIAALVVPLVVRFALRVIDIILDQINRGLVPEASKTHRLLLALKHVIDPVIIAAAILFILSFAPGRGATLVEYAAIGLLALIIIGFWRPFESVIADVILSYLRPYQEGDRIRINDITGVVTTQSAFFLHICDREGRWHFIPKRRLMDTNFTNEGNQSDSAPVRISIRADLSKQADEVENLCREAAEQTGAFVMGGVSVRITTIDLKENLAVYEISGRIRGIDEEAVKSDVYHNIIKALHTAPESP